MASLSSPDPACPICSKPVESGSFVWFEQGQFFHVGCVSRTEQRRTVQQASGFKDAVARAGEQEVVAAGPPIERSPPSAEGLRLGHCVVCRRLFRQGEGYIRRDERLVHVGCWKEEPTP
jgi:hypothetical protein